MDFDWKLLFWCAIGYIIGSVMGHLLVKLINKKKGNIDPGIATIIYYIKNTINENKNINLTIDQKRLLNENLMLLDNINKSDVDMAEINNIVKKNIENADSDKENEFDKTKKIINNILAQLDPKIGIKVLTCYIQFIDNPEELTDFLDEKLAEAYQGLLDSFEKIEEVGNESN